MRERDRMEDGCQNERRKTTKSREEEEKRMAIFNHQHSLHKQQRLVSHPKVHSTPTTTKQYPSALEPKQNNQKMDEVWREERKVCGCISHI
jgi:hypothetical protein